MDFFGPIAQIVVFFWDPICRQIGYIKNLDDNMGTLEKETNELQQMHDQVQADVERAVSVGKLRVSQVDDWLQDVRNFATNVESIRSELDERRTCLMGCCTDYVSRYKLGKNVVEKMESAKALKGKGVFDKAAVAVSPPRPTVLQKQLSLPSERQNTFEQTLETIWQCLHDDENSIICVYGIGGIGKTTLMAAIEKMFSGTNDFSVVMWVTVSKDFRLELIQESIGRQLDIQFTPTEEKRSKLFFRLKNIRYMLILDDLWEAFCLNDVGIPKPNKQNGCKIAITTRSIEVCNDMGANKKIPVSVLTDEEAWSLFHEKAGEVVHQRGILPLAKEVVKECGGLPLAIKVVGGAMREKDKKELWENTLRALKSSAVSEVRGMESKVFIPLKYSYDCLEDPKLQLCFLYCSVFPEDYEISITELVRYWVFEEELVDGTTTLQEALNKGYNIIERLKDSCLLEGIKESNERFRMHDLIRDLAIWIICSLSSSSSSSQPPKFLIKAGEGLELPPGEKIWESARRISLMKNKLEELQIKPRCSNLVTLLLRDNDRLHFIHDHFFENMCELRVLDLSGTDIESLPASLSELKNLRALICQNCSRLEEMPTLKQLEKLQLLDLSKCRIRKLPDGIADLKKLRQLYLNRRSLTTFPCNLICGIKSLEDLTLEGFDDRAATATFREAAANLPRLTTFRICLSSFSGFTADDMNHGFNWEGLRRFEITVGDAALCYKESHMEPYDKIVNIWGLDNLPLWIEGLTRHAEIIRIVECECALAHLTQLIGQSRSIRCISVLKFWGLECIMDGREVGVVGALDWLEILLLCSLHDLRKVFDAQEALQSTCFRKLKLVSIYECHKLKHVFSSSMVENLPQLQELQIQECDAMMEIIEGDSLPALEIWFPRLIILVLHKLPELKRICSQRLAFPAIEHITMRACPELKKLPILCSSIQRVSGEIAGSREWWEGIEWELDDEGHSKSIYTTLYQEFE